jgi:hypothetical protein
MDIESLVPFVRLLSQFQLISKVKQVGFSLRIVSLTPFLQQQINHIIYFCTLLVKFAMRLLDC